MATYPYVSGSAPLAGTVAQLRKGLPAKVDAGYLQRFNIARGNESYVIAILRFLGLIDEEGNPVEARTGFFFGNDETFRSGLEAALREAYSQLFSEMGEGALDAERGTLTHWFRSADKTSEIVGQRQASTFQVLAAMAGHGDMPSVRTSPVKKTPAAGTGGATKGAPARKAPTKKVAQEMSPPTPGVSEDLSGGNGKNGHDVGLTVRIEVNLPPGGDADTYDAIFASIKKHLMS